ncbi:MAG: hypothetical protein K2M97_01905 [Muribaculaceae bacterium]|nr:hypothetical protein [Muribaculaceae bacterium]
MMERFMMIKIQVKQFALLADTLPQDEVGLSTELNFQYSEEAKLVACGAKFKYMTSEQPIMVLEIQCDFAIHPDDWESLRSDGGITLPKSLREILAVHTIGTARGVLFCKTEGTPFNQFMIPPINVAKMMEESDSGSDET